MSEAPVESRVAVAATLNMVARLIAKLNQKGLLSVQEAQDIGRAAQAAATNDSEKRAVNSLLSQLFPNVKFD